MSLLVYKTESLTLTDNGVEIKTGVFSAKSNFVPYDKINNVSYNQSVMDRLLKIGSVSISSGNDQTDIFEFVDDPKSIAELINQKIELNRHQKNHTR